MVVFWPFLTVFLYFLVIISNWFSFILTGKNGQTGANFQHWSIHVFVNLQILRDAKVEHEEKAKMMEQYEEARKANFGALFDENNGELCTFDK